LPASARVLLSGAFLQMFPRARKSGRACEREFSAGRLEIDVSIRRNQFFEGVSRRSFGMAALGLALTVGQGVLAAPGDGLGQAEWAQKFDGDSRLAVRRSTTPVLSQETVAATEQAIERHRQLAASGGWGQVPNQSMKIGARGRAVVALRQRLMASGDLDSAAGNSDVFDSYVEAGVRRFQARHGLGETGVVAQQTLAALNVSADYRLRQLETNLVRLRTLAGNLGSRYVTANIPAAMVETVENGRINSFHAAGVGKIDRQSPVMQTRATDINFNPFWTVPASVIRKDLIPKMQADPNYLTDNKIRIYRQDGQEISPRQVNWNSMEATNYRFRQDTGGDINSLGFVRINIANPYGVYMHDTPAKGIFGDDFRFVSSGCMRLQNVRDYVAFLLRDNPGWDRDKIDETIRSGARVDVKLNNAVPVYWVYVTAWGTPDGVVQFREDIYQRDGLGGPRPMAQAASAPAAQPQRLEPMQGGARPPAGVGGGRQAEPDDDE
jgi:murein L,D-transpeptidase YcbB/YkuD